MSFRVQWDYAAETVLLRHIGWPANGSVAREVYRFAAQRAPRLPSGRYGLRAFGHEIALRVDAREGTVVVLTLYRARGL